MYATLYRGDAAVQGRAVEVFPHASAVTLRGRLPGRGVPKLTWRREALQQAGVEHEPLHTVDQLDAALAALTGIRCLQHRSCIVGVRGESVLALPVPRLPTGRYKRDPADEAVVVSGLPATPARPDGENTPQLAPGVMGPSCEWRVWRGGPPSLPPRLRCQASIGKCADSGNSSLACCTRWADLVSIWCSAAIYHTDTAIHLPATTGQPAASRGHAGG